MVEAVTGAAVAGVIALGYLLLVEVMAAAILLLCQFVVLQARALRALWAEAPRPRVAPVEEQDTAEGKPMYRLGGDVRWQ
jgi:hypothetical protein